MVSMFGFVTFNLWSEYFNTGQIYDGRHGVLLSGNAVFGHLACFTLLTIVSGLYLLKSIVAEIFRRKRL